MNRCVDGQMYLYILYRWIDTKIDRQIARQLTGYIYQDRKMDE